MKRLLSISALALCSFTLAQTNLPNAPALSQIELVGRLATGTRTTRLVELVRNRGLDFAPDDNVLKAMQDDGAGGALVAAVKSAEVRHAITIDPQRPAKDAAALAHLHRAAQLNQNNFHPREAEPEFHSAVDADPDNSFVHVAWGIMLQRIGQGDKALEEFRTALQLEPDSVEARINLGAALTEDRLKRPEALKLLQQAVALDPSDPEAHRRYGIALGSSGDKAGADEQQKAAKELEGSLVPMRIRVGGAVFQTRLLSNPSPRYPAAAKKAHIEGSVRVEVLVGGDGAVKDLEVTSGDPLLAEAAVEAVRQWRYKPTTLNQQPVEVVSEIVVNFQLK